MTKKIIAPRRSENLVTGSTATQRFSEYLEQAASQINTDNDQVDTNKAGIATNVTAINANAAAIAANTTLINAKALLITANANAITANTSLINAKALLITDNENAITAAEDAIEDNEDLIIALTARVVLLEAKTLVIIVTAVDRTATGNEIIICTNSASKTITLMSSPVDQQTMQIKRTDETVIIAGNGKNIDGATSKTLSDAKESATLIYSTTAGFWSVI